MRGFSLTEVMVYMLITVTLTVGLFPFFSSLLEHNRVQKRHNQALQGFSTVTTAFSAELHHLDRSRLPFTPYIFDSAPNFSNRTPIPLTRRMLPNTSGWGLVRPAFLPPFILKNKIPSGKALAAEVCGEAVSAISLNLSSAAVFCDGGMQEVSINIGSRFKKGDGTNCLALTINPVENVTVRSNNDWNLSFAMGIHFIEEIFFYYIDVQRELRRVQLERGKIIENQPVFSNMPLITIKQSIENNVDVYQFFEPSLHLTSRFSRTLLPVPVAVMSLSLMVSDNP